MYCELTIIILFKFALRIAVTISFIESSGKVILDNVSPGDPRADRMQSCPWKFLAKSLLSRRLQSTTFIDRKIFYSITIKTVKNIL